MFSATQGVKNTILYRSPMSFTTTEPPLPVKKINTRELINLPKINPVSPRSIRAA